MLKAEIKTLEEECREKHRRWQEVVKERDAIEQLKNSAKKELRDAQKKLELKDSALLRQQRDVAISLVFFTPCYLKSSIGQRRYKGTEAGTGPCKKGCRERKRISSYEISRTEENFKEER